jgi:hypothetical protein
MYHALKCGGTCCPKPLLLSKARSQRHQLHLHAQIEWGVRVDELHQVSPSAAYIHQGIAKRLQDLWDEGSNLLSLLDDRCALSFWMVIHFSPSDDRSCSLFPGCLPRLLLPRSSVRSSAYLKLVA